MSEPSKATGPAVRPDEPSASPKPDEDQAESIAAAEHDSDMTVMGFPPSEDRSAPEGAEGAEETPSSASQTASTDQDENKQDEDEDEVDHEEKYDSVSTVTSSQVLPWGAPKERSKFPGSFNIDVDVKPGEFVMRTLFAEFTIQVDRKISAIMSEPLERPLVKSLQRGEDPQFDQLLSCFGSVAEQCLPSLLKTLFKWYERQGVEWIVSDYTKHKGDSKGKSDFIGLRSEVEFVAEKRDLAVEFIFCLVLIEVLRQLSVHPGHEDLVHYIEDVSFRHFRYRDTTNLGPNTPNIHIISDLYAEVLGVLAQTRFLSIKRKFFSELRELRVKEASAHTTQSVISLLMGMKFFRVKMVPFEDFEHSFQFMQDLAQYFLEVKDKDIKHALAGLFVEILVPVAAAVKNEVNVPCLKNFVEKLYSQTLDMCTRSKHRLAIFPLVTCLLCVSQKAFFLHNWHYFLTMCLQQLKNRDSKMARVALESLYRLLWVYMIRIKCESNNVTQSRLQSIVNSLFPKGSKGVVPRDAPLNIFVKIIQFIAQEKLDFAMREIVFDLLSVGRPIKVINAPERMSIGLRSFLVVADSLEQKEGDPPMPRTMSAMPSGNQQRVKKVYLSKMLTEETAKNIGLSAYYPYVRKVFDDILRALDLHFGKPFLMTNTQSASKEADDAKPKLDLFRAVIAAIPRLIPDGMSRGELVDTLSRLTVHTDEELRGMAFQSLQNLVNDFSDWREDVLYGFMQFVVKEINDQQITLLDNALRMVSQLLAAWRNAEEKVPTQTKSPATSLQKLDTGSGRSDRPDLVTTLHMAEGFALVMLCHCRLTTRRIAYMILKEVKQLFKRLGSLKEQATVLEILDKSANDVVNCNLHLIPIQDKTAANNAVNLDFLWLVERTSSQWTAGFNDDGVAKSGSTQHLFSADPWSACLLEFFKPDRLLAQCPAAIYQTWPTVHHRLTQLFSVVDPAPVTDNRASLLRPGTAPKKALNEKDISMHLWKNYISMACRVVPAMPNTVVRCVSPDVILSSSPESLGHDRSENKSPSPMVSPTVFYKLLVPLLRCEVPDMRDSVVHALGRINHVALMDLLSELVGYIREAIDRKQENMRRRRRRDALRLQLVRVFDLIAANGTISLALSSGASGTSNNSNSTSRSGNSDANSATISLSNTPFVDYIDGARVYLEGESGDKELAPSVREIKAYFCSFITNLISSFPLEARKDLLRKDLRRKLFYLFAGWSGRFGLAFETTGSLSSSSKYNSLKEDSNVKEFEFSALQAMLSCLCCGPCFDEKALAEEGSLYSLLDTLLTSKEKKIYSLGQKTLVLLLEFNPDITTLLDWVVDKCFTGENQVADGCFLALATIFSAREYPCDHYTAIINVTLMNTGCPRTEIHETALQLLQILDKRFFGSFSPLGSVVDGGEVGGQDPPRRSTLDVLLSTTYSRSQLYLSRQLAQLHPELTMPMFSEICYRLQTARPAITQCLLYYLLPWLYNMELVDPNVDINNSSNNVGGPAGRQTANQSGGREGWGTAEATEMITNNLFYITVKFGDEHPKEVEELWAALCVCWPQNLRIIIRYLFIVSGLAPTELIDYAKRVVLYLGRAQPMKTLDEMMSELQTVETLNCSIERTETPPFYRLTSNKKGHNSNSEWNIQMTNPRQDLESMEKGTIHTKRHSQEEGGNSSQHSRENSSHFTAPFRSAGSMASSAGSAVVAQIQKVGEKVRLAYAKPSILPTIAGGNTNQNSSSAATAGSTGMSQSLVIPSSTSSATSGQPQGASSVMSHSDHQALQGQGSLHFDFERQSMMMRDGGKGHSPGGTVHYHHHHHASEQPHPLPMPEYGGWFAPLTEFLPSTSQPIAACHRCNLAVILIADLVVDGLDLDCHGVDWSVHVPLMLHIIFLGLDNSRELIYSHCQQLLLNLLMVVCEHNDHLSVSSILMNNKTKQMDYGLSLPSLPVIEHNFTEHLMDIQDYLDAMAMEKDEGSDEALKMKDSPNKNSDDEDEEDDDEGQEDDDKDQDKEEEEEKQKTKRNIMKSRQRSGNRRHRSSDDTGVTDLTKALIHFIASRKDQPLWQYEDITRTVWSIRSAEQIDVFLQHVLNAFEMSLPHAHLAERWSQLALQLALSCSSRHYAGRSLQIFRALRVPITSRMLSDILSRLVETVAEQGEDMQGYVTELILTLEAVVDALDSDIRPLDMSREIFKSTPNLQEMLESAESSLSINKEQVNQTTGGKSGAAQMNRRSIHNQPSGNDVHIHQHQQASSPMGCGHGYHASVPTGGPYSMYPYERSITYHLHAGYHKLGSPTNHQQIGDMRGRSSTESNGRHVNHQGGRVSAGSLSRSRSAQSLKLQDQTSQDDKMNILVQLFWICLAVLESDYEHEFLLGLRLLERVLARLPLDRPDVRDKLEKLQIQLKWPNFPGVHALLLKGCTNPNTYEATIHALSQMTLLLDHAVIDPSQQSLAFPMNVIALLPYMVQNYEDANELCVRSAENIAQVSTQKTKQLENLATVMTLYSRRTFSKESFQWTKCVVKYLYDLYSHFSFHMLGFLVEVLEKGSISVQGPVLTIIHCLMHYVDMSQATQMINADLLRTVVKFIESTHWKEALKILKLAVTRSSTLAAPTSGSASMSYYWEMSSGQNFAEPELYFRKELPGRTMEFTFDLSQTPVIGRRTSQQQSFSISTSSSSQLPSYSSARSYFSGGGTSSLASLNLSSGIGSTASSTVKADSTASSVRSNSTTETAPCMSPKRSMSLTAADSNSFSGWKRPWMKQSAVREKLVNLLNSCGQRVGLPKSPSGDLPTNMKVIFSQTSELLERQSSMASSTEEVSGNNDLSNESRQHDTTDTEQKFGMYMREFDFLEYELESLEGESVDNFNWGVRRPSLSHLDESTLGLYRYDSNQRRPGVGVDQEEPVTNESRKRRSKLPEHHRSAEAAAAAAADESSDDELGSQLSNRSSADEQSGAYSSSVSSTSSALFPPKSLPLDAIGQRRFSTPNSGLNSDDTDEDDDGELTDHDLTPCNASPRSFSQMLNWSSDGGGLGGGPGKFLYCTSSGLDHEGIEDLWKNHVHVLTQNTSNETLLETFLIFSKLFDELRHKACLMSHDSIFILGKEKAHFNQDLFKRATDGFQGLTDILMELKTFPFVWCEFENVGGTRLIERAKFNVLELQENVENFNDKTELTMECLDAVKAHQKLVNLGENMDHYNIDTEQVDLCRCLYKLHFQLLLILESFIKLLKVLVSSAATSDQEVKDISERLRQIQAELLSAATEELLNQSGHFKEKSASSPDSTATLMKDLEDQPRRKPKRSQSNPEIKVSCDQDQTNNDFESGAAGSSGFYDEDQCSLNSSEISTMETIHFEATSRRESEYHVFGLVCEEKYAAAMVYYSQQHLPKWITNGAVIAGSKRESDKVQDIMTLYCQILAERGENIICITVSDSELSNFCNRLMDACMALLNTIKAMENQLAKQKQRPSSDNR